MEWLEEFYLNNHEWLDRLVSGLLSALVGYLTALFTTRRSKLESLVDGLHVYDDNDLVLIPGTTDWVELGKLTVCRKGKNADAKKN